MVCRKNHISRPHNALPVIVVAAVAVIVVVVKYGMDAAIWSPVACRPL